MGTFIVVFVFMLVVVLLMAVGVVMGRRPISGSCGGLSGLGLKSACDVCSGKDECKNKKNKSTNIAFDETKQLNE